MKYSNTYILEIQYLGFRFSGWQKQQNQSTLHQIIDKTFDFLLENVKYKTLGMSRTDAKVSAQNYFLQLFIDQELSLVDIQRQLNSNLPQDVKVLSINQVDVKFNIIDAPKTKEYHYYFSYGEKNHPFAAPFLIGFEEHLDIELMKKGANLFIGEHYFNKYCTNASDNTILKRTINDCKIIENQLFTASFFPKKSFVLIVKGKGFVRHQIRLMMATLVELGKGNINLQFIEDSLKETNDKQPLPTIAPASGLHLYAVEFKQ